MPALLKITNQIPSVLHLSPIYDTVNSLTLEIELANSTSKVRYSWSYDNVNWSAYVEDVNYVITSINDAAPDVTMYVKIELSMIPNVEVQDEFKKEYDDNSELQDNLTNHHLILNSVKINDEDHEIESIELVNAIHTVRYHENDLFNPYARLDISIDLQKDISDSINSMFGLEVYYFRTNGDEDKLYTFKQYALKNVTDVKKLKVLPPRNKLPDNRNIFNEWGINFSEELLIHVVNRAFETAFGVDKSPQEKDFLWFPLAQRMYEVNSVSKLKKFMQSSIYHELLLMKYEDRATVVKTDETNALINNFIEFFEDSDTFTEELKEKQLSFPDHLDLTMTDAYRLSISSKVNIVKNPYVYNGHTVYSNMYVLSNLTISEVAVVYKFNVQELEHFTISCSFIFELLQDQDLIVTNGLKLKIINKRSIIEFLGIDILSSSIDLIELNRYSLVMSFSRVYNTVRLGIVKHETSSSTLVEFIETIADITNYENEEQIRIIGGRLLYSNFCITDTYVNREKMISRSLHVENSQVLVKDTCISGISGSKLSI